MAGPPAAPKPTKAQLAADQSPMLIAIFVIFTILPLVAVFLRLLARRITKMKLWWDDWLLVISSALCIVQFAFLMEAIKYGLGKHVYAIDPTFIEPYLMYTYMSELYYALTVTAIKCSILLLYLRIFRIQGKFRWACYGMLGFVLVWGLATLLVTIFQCSPVQGAWDKTIEGWTCFNLQHFVVGTNVPNIIADAVIIVLPLPLVWKLQVSITRKIGLVVVFLLAAITTIISILRVAFNANIDILDPTWNFVDVAILSTVEVNVGVCCACMPVVYPLFRILVGRRINPTTRNTGSSNAHSGISGPLSRSRGNNFSKLDEGSDTDQLWSNASGGGSQAKEDVPMGRITVTRNFNMQSMQTPEPPGNRV